MALLEQDIDDSAELEYFDAKLEVLSGYILGEISQACRKCFTFLRVN